MLYVNLAKRMVETSDGRVSVDRDLLDQLLKNALLAIEFDENYYLKKNPDVADWIRKGFCRSARDHFVQFGYKEGRLPRSIPVDKNFYVAIDDQLRLAVDSGGTTPGEHFEKYGSREGRSPFDGFSLFANR